jgi:hypothetical protein
MSLDDYSLEGLEQRLQNAMGVAASPAGTMDLERRLQRLQDVKTGMAAATARCRVNHCMLQISELKFARGAQVRLRGSSRPPRQPASIVV